MLLYKFEVITVLKEYKGFKILPLKTSFTLTLPHSWPNSMKLNLFWGMSDIFYKNLGNIFEEK